MIKNNDIINMTDIAKNTLDTALGYLLFIKKESAEQYINELEDVRIDIACELSQKNVEYETAACKCLKLIREEYLPKLQSFWDSDKTYSSQNNIRDLVNDLSKDAIDAIKQIVHVNDESYTISNITKKMSECDITSKYDSFISSASDSLVKIQRLLVNHNITTNPEKNEMKSNFDTFCVRTQNILFNKYLVMLTLREKFDYITLTMDALSMVSILISTERLFTQDKVLEFLKNKPFEKAALILKECGDIGRP